MTYAKRQFRSNRVNSYVTTPKAPLSAIFVPPQTPRINDMIATPATGGQVPEGSSLLAAVPKEPGQTGIREVRTAPDGTVAWLAEYRVEAMSYPIAGTLIVWRAGKTIQRFSAQ